MMLTTLRKPLAAVGSEGNRVMGADTMRQKVIDELLATSPDLVSGFDRGEVEEVHLKQGIVSIIDRLELGYYRDEILTAVFDYLFGYGPLEDLLTDPEVTDIDATRYHHFTVKRGGERKQVAVAFENERLFTAFCKLLIIRNGGVINESRCHARVSDEKRQLRINVTVPPLNATGSSLSIRKHARDRYDLDRLVDMGMMPRELSETFRDMMASHARFLICGKGGAGKTTLLRALLEEIPWTQRLLICESDAEIFPEKPNLMVHRIRKQKGQKLETLQGLIQDGLTMSLDGYCIGEIVGEEAWEFIKAGFTDHRIMATLHAMGPEEALLRLYSLMRTTNDPETSKRMIARGIDKIIYMRGFRVESIVEEIAYEGTFRFSYQYEREADRREEEVRHAALDVPVEPGDPVHRRQSVVQRTELDREGGPA